MGDKITTVKWWKVYLKNPHVSALASKLQQYITNVVSILLKYYFDLLEKLFVTCEAQRWIEILDTAVGSSFLVAFPVILYKIFGNTNRLKARNAAFMIGHDKSHVSKVE